MCHRLHTVSIASTPAKRSHHRADRMSLAASRHSLHDVTERPRLAGSQAVTRFMGHGSATCRSHCTALAPLPRYLSRRHPSHMHCLLHPSQIYYPSLDAEMFSPASRRNLTAVSPAAPATPRAARQPHPAQSTQHAHCRSTPQNACRITRGAVAAPLTVQAHCARCGQRTSASERRHNAARSRHVCVAWSG